MLVYGTVHKKGYKKNVKILWIAKIIMTQNIGCRVISIKNKNLQCLMVKWVIHPMNKFLFSSLSIQLNEVLFNY